MPCRRDYVRFANPLIHDHSRAYRRVRQLEMRRQSATVENRAAQTGSKREHHLEPGGVDNAGTMDFGVIECHDWLAGRF